MTEQTLLRKAYDGRVDQSGSGADNSCACGLEVLRYVYMALDERSLNACG